MDETKTRLEQLEAKRNEITAQMKKMNRYTSGINNNPFYCNLRDELYKTDLEIIDLKEKQKHESKTQTTPGQDI